MPDFRITDHPIIPIPEREKFTFYWEAKRLPAIKGDTISAALFANGIRVFGYHPKDHAPQGIFCANGQCSQCMVIANGKPVKSCMELVEPGMKVNPLNGLPTLPNVEKNGIFKEIETKKVSVLIIGGGPAGLSASLELGKLGFSVLLVDDKHRLGGKLILQTHRFFGSSEAVYAGTRGIDIATRLEDTVRSYPSVEIWLKSTALAAFSDNRIGILKNGDQYVLVEPEIVLVATGAREKFLAFKGNTIPGVYGAGAFQTLVNRDLVRPAKRVFIVGGGNVGLIAGYHALQGGMEVIGLVEALPECGGYKVHKDKLVRMGVPVYTSHTVLSANGEDYLESVTIAQVNSKFKPIPGTEKSFACDCLLIAVGLDPVNEILLKARDFGFNVFAAGDAEEVAEASAAIFSGRIRGFEIAKKLGKITGEVPQTWFETSEILKSKPGRTLSETYPSTEKGVVPILHCTQEIPCNPCSTLCTQGLIKISEKDMRDLPKYIANEDACKGCLKCVMGCPGLAITLVDYRPHPKFATVSIPYELGKERLHKDDLVTLMNTEGNPLGTAKVLVVKGNVKTDRTYVITVQSPREYATRIAGLQVQPSFVSESLPETVPHVADDMIVCRCERVTAGEIREVIRRGFRDMNEIKTVTRAGMGACGAKTCTAIIQRIFREEGIAPGKITDPSRRPLFVEVPLGIFAGEQEGKGSND
jgi:NADPH-dependent 2,4-dienoyl-CoA reductase/sulfur reductase-like enzyme/Fe-S-cluster-containing hydrogenase component 2/bacterioferritin-associated ferredoxin